MQGTVETQAKDLRAFVKAIPGTVHVAIEEGLHATWMYDLLRPLVAEIIVCDNRKNKSKGNKSDRIDARKLAELLRTNQLSAVYHGEHGTRRLKQLGLGYYAVIRDVVRNKNRVKSVFRSQSVAVGGASVYDPEGREEWLAKLSHDGLRHRACWYLTELDLLTTLRVEAEAALLAEAKKHRASRLLQTVPGIGPIRAALIVAVVDTPFRFRTKKQFWSYVGLSVVTRSTDDFGAKNGRIFKKKGKRSTRGLTQNHNRMMKMVFIGAAFDATVQGAWKARAEELVASGRRPEMVRLTFARKAAAIALALWKNGEKYNPKKAFTRMV
jgi:transposase